MENNNKEAFKLLGLSGSETGSDVQEFALPQRKRKVKRRIRGRVSREGPSGQGPTSCCCCGPGSRARAWRWALGLIFLGGWMLGMTWVALTAHGDVATLDVRLQAVSSSSDGVSSELYQCRSAARQLQLNQSQLAGQIENLTARLSNVTLQLGVVTAGLTEVQKRVQAAPQLVAVPQQLSALSANVASLGSQIQELKATTVQLQAQGVTMSANVTALQSSVERLNNTAQSQQAPQSSGAGGRSGTQEEEQARIEAEKEASSRHLAEQLAGISSNLTQINASLSGRLQWAMDDLNKHHKIIEGLQEIGQNVSARVTTLEGECSSLSAKQKPLEDSVSQVTSQMTGTLSRTTQLESRVGKLQEVYSELQTQAQQAQQARMDRVQGAVTTFVPSATTPTLPAVATEPKPAASGSVPSKEISQQPGNLSTAIPSTAATRG